MCLSFDTAPFVYDAYNLPGGQRKCEIKGGTFVFF